jgi:hypothetical protein
MEDGSTKNILMEPYGLPHACDERKKHFDTMSQEKKDEYAKEKTRVQAIPDNSGCPICVGGIVPGVQFGNSACPVFCRACDGRGKITAKVKERMLWKERQRIWPGIGRGTKR